MMLTEIKPLLDHCAGDLMSKDVVMIPQEMSIQGAARLLSRSHVSGAPVVDHDGRCIGVISATDFIHWAEGRDSAVAKRTAENCLCSAWQIPDENKLPDTSVRCFMTSDPVTALAKTSIGDLAQTMLDAHIHRVIVVDDNQRPVGVVSSTDILAAVARADHAIQ